MTERTKTITLLEPISSGADYITEIELRAPKLGEVEKALSEGKRAKAEGRDEGLATMKSLLQSVTGHSRAVVEQLPIDQLMEGGEFLLGFFGKAPGQE